MIYNLIGWSDGMRSFSDFIKQNEFNVHGVVSFEILPNVGDWPEMNVTAVEKNIVEILANRFELKLK